MKDALKKIFHMGNIKSFYQKYDGRIGALTLLLGFIFDNLTLRGAHINTQTTVFVIYLFLSCISILALNFLTRDTESSDYPRVYFWTFLLLQFSVGSLFSMFFVFYSRGFSISATWPLLLFLFANMLGSELMKKRYSRLSVQISLLFISIFSFCIYFLPILVHRVSGWIFVASGILSFVLVYLFVQAVKLVAKKKVEEERKRIILGVAIVYFLINIFYVFNVIPPVPLVMKDGGVYHSISWENGSYVVLGEQRSFWDFLKLYPIYHHIIGDPVYVVTAVYAPAALDTTIVHNWQFYNESKGEWQSVTKIPVAIVGGREGGYRSYSVKQNAVPGRWRVDMETANGKIIGRIKFEIVEDLPTGQAGATNPNLVQEYY